MTLVLACGALIVAVLGWVLFGGRRSAPPPPADAVVEAPPPDPAHARPAPTLAPVEETAGPWSGVALDLRAAAESRLTTYARALEIADPTLLAVARPDLSPQQRERLLEPYRQAQNAATDLRVVRVVAREGAAEVVVQRSDVIVGGPPRPPIEETLRFRRESGEWVLR
jgi:hypothetical protein